MLGDEDCDSPQPRLMPGNEDGFAPRPDCGRDPKRRDDVYMGKRIIISFPSHPLFMSFYLLLLLPIFIGAPRIFAYFSLLLGISLWHAVGLGMLVFLASLLSSPFNIVIKEIATGEATVVLEQRYIYFFGFPVPVISPRIVERKVIIAVNIGGALIPILISLLLLFKISLLNPYYLCVLLVGIVATSIIAYMFSRALPGVGIVMPGFIPPLSAVIVTVMFVDKLYLAIPIAYISGSLGSLIGADVLRLLRELDKFIYSYGSSVLSIGGAGTFDGIYLSGIIASMLVPLFYT